jgi:hypothetical protein
MPAPQASAMQQLAKLKFKSFQIHLPSGFTNPEHHLQYDPPRPADVATSAGWLFIPDDASIKEHVSTVKDISQQFSAYIDGICSAICSAWSTWQSSASMVAVLINAVTAGMGTVVGPPMTPLILAQGPKGKPQEMKYTQAIATAIGTGWLSYTASIKLAAMPLYPAFATFPSPMAPPTPNVPSPLIALTQVTTSISASSLKDSMVGLLGDQGAAHHKELFGAVADAFEKCFTIWQSSTQVTNVLGTGAIPTFAPPVMPAGPVVAGIGTMTPGGFV